MTCGHVGCCDSSPNKHATKHFHAVGHPIIKSFQPGEDWGWCYVDEALLEPEDSLPAAGQGALGIECRDTRTDLIEMLAPLKHADSEWCVRAERSVSRALSGSCTVPIGAFAQRLDGGIYLRGFVASPDGTRYVAADEHIADAVASPETAGQALADKLTAHGAREILAALAHDQ